MKFSEKNSLKSHVHRALESADRAPDSDDARLQARSLRVLDVRGYRFRHVCDGPWNVVAVEIQYDLVAHYPQLVCLVFQSLRVKRSTGPLDNEPHLVENVSDRSDFLLHGHVVDHEQIVLLERDETGEL